VERSTLTHPAHQRNHDYDGDERARSGARRQGSTAPHMRSDRDGETHRTPGEAPRTPAYLRLPQRGKPQKTARLAHFG
jgi:hypothetical protein